MSVLGLYRLAFVPAAITLVLTFTLLGDVEPIVPARDAPAIDREAALGDLRAIVSATPRRIPETDQGTQAADDMERRLTEAGERGNVAVVKRALPATVGGRTRALTNVIATPPGTTPERIVVAAHRDNTGPSGGADDNASGSAALIDMVRRFSATDHQRTLVFLSYDGGATSAAGVRGYLDELPDEERPVAAVVLDRLAGPGRTWRVTPWTDGAAAAPPSLVEAAADAGRLAGLSAVVPGTASGLNRLALPVSVSGAAPFGDAGVPAVAVGIDAERPADIREDGVDRIDPDAFARRAQAATALVTTLDQATLREAAVAPQRYLRLGGRTVRGGLLTTLEILLALPPLVFLVAGLRDMRRRRGRLARGFVGVGYQAAPLAIAAMATVTLTGAGVFARGGELAPSSLDASVRDRPWVGLMVVGLIGLCAYVWSRRGLARLDARSPDGAMRSVAEVRAAALVVLVAASAIMALANPFALFVVLPAAHVAPWLAHPIARRRAWRLGLLAASAAGAVAAAAGLMGALGVGPWYLVLLATTGVASPIGLLGLGFVAVGVSTLWWQAAGRPLRLGVAISAERRARAPELDRRDDRVAAAHRRARAQGGPRRLPDPAGVVESWVTNLDLDVVDDHLEPANGHAARRTSRTTRVRGPRSDAVRRPR